VVLVEQSSRKQFMQSLNITSVRFFVYTPSIYRKNRRVNLCVGVTCETGRKE
jgi:hypothetical protein